VPAEKPTAKRSPSWSSLLITARAWADGAEALEVVRAVAPRAQFPGSSM
jgi:hypothetical protein